VIDSYNRDQPDQGLVEKYMEDSGYTLNTGKWQKNGVPLAFSVIIPDWLGPIGPVVAGMLQTAGFAAFESPDSTNSYSGALSSGDFDAIVMVHCGSLFDPYNTLNDYGSQNYTPIGSRCPNQMGCTRYKNPE